MRKLQRNLPASAQVVLNAAGTGTVSIPCPLGPSWEVKQISVFGTSAIQPMFTWYRGTNSNGLYGSSTPFGNGKTDSNPNLTLKPGDSLAGVWTNGSLGSGTMRMTIIYDEVDY